MESLSRETGDAHGDRERTGQEWACRQMEENLLVKVVGRCRGDEQDSHELRVLNRVLRVPAAAIF